MTTKEYDVMRKICFDYVKGILNIGVEEALMNLYHFQFEFNSSYQAFCNLLSKTPKSVQSVRDIPCLPVQFFKRNEIKTGTWKEEIVFRSSGTQATGRSQHFVRNLEFYQKHTERVFNHSYGELKDFEIYALLPSYHENPDSSLINMVTHFMSQSNEALRFYKGRLDILSQDLKSETEKKKLLLGVSFALLDLCELHPGNYSDVVLMETGGMKSKRKEMPRKQIHEQLNQAFQTSQIHSEYGMSECLSQAYSKGEGTFDTNPWFQIKISDIQDPLAPAKINKAGRINIMDLANIDSCAFIATDDLGKFVNPSQFEVLGRVGQAEIRGCNLLFES